jgi:hypothetical protein
MDSLAKAQMRQEAILAGEKVPIDLEEGTITVQAKSGFTTWRL